MKNFLEKLPKPARPRQLTRDSEGGLAHDGSGAGGPFFCLAPMADVTDAAFRRIITKYGKPDVLWTEFTSADGLVSEGRKILKNNLIFSKKEHPIVAQLFSSNPESMRRASRYIASLGFDGIDINMGCPDKSIEKQGAGAAMMKDMEKAGKIIQAVKDGIKDSGKKIPVSVKTRIGYNKNQINEWIPFLLSQDIAVLTIHARTRKDLSLVPANWEYVKRIVEIRNEMKVKTLIIGNGDVIDLEDGKRKAKETGCDGIMVGRAIFGNPWLFANLACARHNCQIEHPVLNLLVDNKKKNNKNIILDFNVAQSRNSAERSECATCIKCRKFKTGVTVEQKLKVMVEHTKLFEKILGKQNPIRTNGRKQPTSNGARNFAIMKKHFKAYVNGFEGAKELRVKLMETKSSKEVEIIVNKFLKK